MTTNKQNKGKLYGIGIGPGDPDLLTLKAVKALGKADIICVPKSKEQASTALAIVSEFISKNSVVEYLTFPMSRDVNVRIEARKQNANLIENLLSTGKNIAFLTLGDPMLYSTYSYILEYLNPEYEVETIPGIYSFAAISSLLNLPLCKDDDQLSVIGSFDKNASSILELSDTTVCMKISRYSNQLYDFLANHPQYNFVMITEAGKEKQEIFNSIEVLKEDVPYFSTAIIQKNKN